MGLERHAQEKVTKTKYCPGSAKALASYLSPSYSSLLYKSSESDLEEIRGRKEEEMAEKREGEYDYVCCVCM